MSGLIENSSVQVLSHLLPYDMEKKCEDKDISTGLKEYKMLTTGLEQALQAFKNGEFENFDSLVGENACQIRAFKIAILANKKFIDFDALHNQIARVQQEIDALLASKTRSTPRYNASSLSDLLAKEKLDITLTSDEMFLVQAYLLWKTKVPKPYTLCLKEVTEPKQLIQLGAVSPKFTDRLVRRLRQLLSTASVAYVRDCAAALKDNTLVEMSADRFTIKHNDIWPCTPMFWTYKTLLQTALKEGVPLVVHVKFLDQDADYKVVDQDRLLFQVGPEAEGVTARYIGTDLPTLTSKDILDKPVCVIQGAVSANKDNLPSKAEWRAKFLIYSIIDVILSGAADHRQYPDSEKDHLVNDLNNEEYELYKKMAKENGFSFDNPTMFFIQHVYAAQIKKMACLPE